MTRMFHDMWSRNFATTSIPDISGNSTSKNNKSGLTFSINLTPMTPVRAVPFTVILA